VHVVAVESALQMLEACQAVRSVDVAVCAAAVADWRVAEPSTHKVKRNSGPPALALSENPDILKTLSAVGPARPKLVIGFAAETDDVVANARRKLATKGCDWIVANDVSAEQNVFGSVENTVRLIRSDADPEAWPKLAKTEVAVRLTARIVAHLRGTSAVAA
jgi:phosphopantothenoylcysteine decarboxylase/phosphopantothenate--cysteine ligase